MQSLDNPAAYHVGLALLGVGGVFVFSSFLALGFTGTFLGKTLSVGGWGPAPHNSRLQPALLSMGDQALKPQPAAWPPGWAELLLLCSGPIGAGASLALVTIWGADPSACLWLWNFGAESPVLAGLDVRDIQLPVGTPGGRSRAADVPGAVGQSRRPARITSLESLKAMQGTGASSQEESPAGEVLWGPRSSWGSWCGPHRGGVREGREGWYCPANLRRPAPQQGWGEGQPESGGGKGKGLEHQLPWGPPGEMAWNMGPSGSEM